MIFHDTTLLPNGSVRSRRQHDTAKIAPETCFAAAVFQNEKATGFPVA